MSELYLYYAPHCPYCRRAGETVDQILRPMGLSGSLHHRNVLEHIDAAVAAGVRQTPALTLDDKLIASGAFSADELSGNLAKVLSGENDQ